MKQQALLIPRPGARFGRYPEKTLQREPWPWYPAELVRARLLSVRAPSMQMQARFLALVHTRRASLEGCDIEFVGAGVRRLRAKLMLEGMQLELVAEIFALIDACVHSCLKLRLHDAQFLAAWMMLDRRLVEMQTGEGKTLAVAVAAATGALAGIPVHVVTANDYLVERDAANLRPVFRMLGLTVGAIVATTKAEDRPRISQSDITYCTAKELAFDYLRDRLAASETTVSTATPKRILRGLCMAIIDEADSVLIDEARMPLILSQRTLNTGQSAFYRQALFLASQLKPDEHYRLDHAHRRVVLTEAGKTQAEALARHAGGAWKVRRRREEMLCLALTAQHLFIRQRHYLVRDGEVVIIDETTGRAASGRVWSGGLHQLIELKENCPVTEQQQTVTQTTFQRFFSRYLRLSGISGTLMEARHELLATYGLPVVRIPLQHPCRRTMLPGRVFANPDAQWQYVVDRVQSLHALGRPVLVGTDSIGDSEQLSSRLAAASVPHKVLKASFDAEEACIVAEAGRAGAVTISTNMAGRGTDIRLSAGVAERGGMHVIACQSNDSARIDRQLVGRCARQGEPGSAEQIYCSERAFLPLPISGWLMHRLACASGKDCRPPRWPVWLASGAQAMRARYRRKEQWFLFLREKQIDHQLAFAGERE